MGFRVLRLWGCGVDGIYDYEALFGFLLNFDF